MQNIFRMRTALKVLKDIFAEVHYIISNLLQLYIPGSPRLVHLRLSGGKHAFLVILSPLVV